MLLDAIAFFENSRRINMDEGRAGIAPPNLDNLHVNATDRNCQKVGQPCGRAQALEMLIPCPGGLSTWQGRIRGVFPPTPTIPQDSQLRLVGPVVLFSPPGTSPQPIRRGRGRCFPPSSPPTPPPPLEDYSPPVRHWEALPRQPCTMPFVYGPMVIFHSTSLFST